MELPSTRLLRSSIVMVLDFTFSVAVRRFSSRSLPCPHEWRTSHKISPLTSYLDATQPSSNEHWRALTFNHDENDYSSSVCHVGSHPTMRCHKPSTSWPEMLLPSIYHGPDTSHDGYGGLIGELPIFLALITFSMQPQELPNVLPQIFRNGQWATHSLKHRRKLLPAATH